MDSNIIIYNTGDIVFPGGDPVIDSDVEEVFDPPFVVVHMQWDNGWQADKTPAEVWDICHREASVVWLRDANDFIYQLERIDSRKVSFVHIEYNGDEAAEPCRFVRLWADQLTGEWHSNNE